MKKSFEILLIHNYDKSDMHSKVWWQLSVGHHSLFPLVKEHLFRSHTKTTQLKQPHSDKFNTLLLLI